MTATSNRKGWYTLLSIQSLHQLDNTSLNTYSLVPLYHKEFVGGLLLVKFLRDHNAIDASFYGVKLNITSMTRTRRRKIYTHSSYHMSIEASTRYRWSKRGLPAFKHSSPVIVYMEPEPSLRPEAAGIPLAAGGTLSFLLCVCVRDIEASNVTLISRSTPKGPSLWSSMELCAFLCGGPTIYRLCNAISTASFV